MLCQELLLLGAPEPDENPLVPVEPMALAETRELCWHRGRVGTQAPTSALSPEPLLGPLLSPCVPLLSKNHFST